MHAVAQSDQEVVDQARRVVAAEGRARWVTAKSKRDMPLVARVIALVFGVLLTVGSVLIFFFVRPLDFKLAVLGMTLATTGTDLLEGAIQARWPVFAMLGLLT